MPATFFYDNLLRGATVVSEDTITNFELAEGLDGRTSTQVGMSSGATRDIIVDFGSAKTFEYVCVANHNLNGTTLDVAGSSDDVTYTPISSIVYDNNYVRADQITESTYRYVRLRFSGHAADIYIADIFVGQADLELLYGVPYGFTPPEQADQDRIKANITGGGALVGLEVEKKPKPVNLSLNDYPASWYESNWQAFTDSLKQYPAYFLWATGKRAMYFTIKGKIGSPVHRSNLRQSITLKMIGFVE